MTSNNNSAAQFFAGDTNNNNAAHDAHGENELDSAQRFFENISSSRSDMELRPSKPQLELEEAIANQSNNNRGSKARPPPPVRNDDDDDDDGMRHRRSTNNNNISRPRMSSETGSLPVDRQSDVMLDSTKNNNNNNRNRRNNNDDDDNDANPPPRSNKKKGNGADSSYTNSATGGGGGATRTSRRYQTAFASASPAEEEVNSLFKCCAHPSSCYESIVCCPCQIQRQLTAIEPESHGNHNAFWALYAAAWPCVIPALRFEVATRMNREEACCGDFFAGTFCPCLSLAQTYRQLTYLGKPPGGWFVEPYYPGSMPEMH